jgi:hypothetical protein
VPITSYVAFAPSVRDFVSGVAGKLIAGVWWGAGEKYAS